MKKIKYRISLDMLEVASQTTIKVKKGDTACSILITLTENGKIYHISEGCRAVFSAKKADGNYIFNSETCSIVDNTIVYDFTKQTVACEGIAECEVILYKGEEKLTSPRFDMVVDNTVYNGEEIISSPEADALNDLIDEAEKLIEEDWGKGKSTSDGGEIFNDYKTNKAISKHTHTEGSQNIAGAKGFSIGKWCALVLKDFSSVTIVRRADEDKFPELTKGAVAVLRLAFNYLLKFDGVDYLDAGTYYRFTPISPIVDGISTPNGSYYDLEMKKLTDEEKELYPWYNTIFFVDYPQSGDRDIGLYASASGLENKSFKVATRTNGRGNTVLGDYGSADGQGNTVGYCSHSGGRDNEILGEYCDGNGQNNKVPQNSRYSCIHGYKNILSDTGEEKPNDTGDQTRQDANNISGFGNVVKGFANFVSGMGNKVISKLSFVSGQGNEITAPLGRAGGLKNKVTGDIGDAYGNETVAGNTAVSRGYKTKALGWLSAAFGYETRANNNSQFVLGQFNANKGDTYLEVGNGSSDTSRSNAFEVKKNGTIVVGGVALTPTQLQQLLSLLK